MATSAEQMRAWRGPAILTFGFRPFFLFGALWAALAMAMWIAMLSGMFLVPTAFDPVSWHAHEMLFGYLNAIVAGFLLTAVPNWTGRLPITGWPLAGLVVLWLAGRVSLALSAHMTPLVAALIDLAMPVALMLAIAREIWFGRNWRNLIVLMQLMLLITGNAVFHYEAASGEFAAQGYGLRIGLAAAIMMIAIIGGRIVPSFTRNWLAKQAGGHKPAPPMGRYDVAALLLLAVTLIAWIAMPNAETTGVLLLLAGAAHLLRLARWSGHHTVAEPLVWVLHAGYGFVPLGALAMGFVILVTDAPGIQAAQHLWMAGAVGLMTLAVMTRATLGHTGRPLAAGAMTTSVYALLIFAVGARLAAGFIPDAQNYLNFLAGFGWIAAFAGFAGLYGPLLLTARKDG